MRDWLESRENGTSEVELARTKGRDIRTIRASLQKAMDERRFNLAQIELLRNALKAHQEQLMGAVDWLQQNDDLPPRDLDIPWPVGSGEINSSSEEPPLEVALLREHLPKDQLWIRLDRWQKARKDYIDSLANVKQIAAEMLMQRTGGVFVDERFNPIEGAPTSVVNSENTVKLVESNLLELAYKRSIDSIFQKIPHSNENLEKSIKIDKHSGEARLGQGNTLAICPGKESVCKASIVSVLIELPVTPAANRIKTSWEELVAAKKELDETLKEIKLGILITGQCRICKRLKG